MKKILATILAMALLLSFAACSGTAPVKAENEEQTDTPKPRVVTETDDMTPEMRQVLADFRESARRDLTVDDLVTDYREDFYMFFELYEVGDDGWMTINGERVAPVACRVASSLNPQDLLDAYQAGYWDGLPVWSKGYGTRAYVSDSGQLSYEYDNQAAVRANDPNCPVYLYTEYDSPVWEGDEFENDPYAHGTIHDTIFFGR